MDLQSSMIVFSELWVLGEGEEPFFVAGDFALPIDAPKKAGHKPPMPRFYSLSTRFFMGGSLFAFGAAMLFAMQGCGNEAPKNDPNDPAPTSATSQEQESEISGALHSQTLQKSFPEQAALVLDRPEARFEPYEQGGYWLRVGAPMPGEDAEGMAQKGAWNGMDAFLPSRADDALRLHVGGAAQAFEIRIRELEMMAGADVLRSHRALAYARAGGTAFWTANSEGIEEWLHLSADYVRRDAPAATWEIEGGKLRVMEDQKRVAVLDEAGVARIWVTAPTVFALTGRPVEASFRADGHRLMLYVDIDAEELLIDPVWTQVAPMATGREFPAPVLLQNGKVLVSGGYSTTWINGAEIYDPATNIWSSAGSVPGARAGHTATLLNDGRVFVAGGYDGSMVLGSSAIYNPATNTWSVAAGMGTPRTAHTAALLNNGKVLVAGGQGLSTNPTASAELYDPASNTWAVVASLTESRYYAASAKLPNGKVLVAGGTTNFMGFPLPIDALSAELFDPATNVWTAAGSLVNGRQVLTLTLLGTGKVLAAGGYSSLGGNYVSAAELYDPAANSWAPAASGLSARSNHSATLLPNGQVLVAGGMTTGNIVLTSSELYTPASNTWVAAASLNKERNLHGAVLLQNGNVLVMGGQINDGTRTATAERFSNGALGDACVLAADCQSGVCSDGVCCNVACGGAGDCMMCNAPATMGSCVLAPMGTTCRASAGGCDMAETCDGANSACPANGLSPAGTVCRAASGSCDMPELCDGGNANCPADVFVSAGTLCRVAVDTCDAPEACTGAGPNCPADGVLGAGVPCRASLGPCDAAEGCNGLSPLCPADTFVAAGTPCRASVGPCDLAESCSGMGAACPADVFVPAGTSCRAAAGPCDVAESCDGMAAGCPVDAFAATGTQCRAAVDLCDAAESCTGMGAACPVDGVAAAGTPCRAAAGACDLEESCTGSGIACPADAFVGAGTPCRAAAGACDVGESCSGALADCPADIVQADGTLCNDGNACSQVDSCMSGQCTPGVPVDCTAKDSCQNDGACDPVTGACVVAPPKGDGTACPGGSCKDGSCVPDGMGAGGSGASSSGSGSGGAKGDPESDGGCGCHAVGADGSSKGGYVLGLLLALGLAASRRRSSWL